MKIFNKIVSLLSVFAIMSTMAFSVSAADANVMKINVTDADGNAISTLAAGETVVVTMEMDEVLGLTAIGYKLAFDESKLSYDTTMQGTGASANKCPKWMDLSWWNDARQGNSIVGAYFGKLTYSLKDSKITIGFAGTDPIEDSEPNAVVGKFYFTAISEISASNQITFSVDSFTTGKPADTPGICEAVTVPEAGEEVEKTLTIDEAKAELKKEKAPSGKYTIGYANTVSGGATFSKIVFTIADNAAPELGTATHEWTVGTAIEANNVTFGLNIWGAPETADLEITAVAE